MSAKARSVSPANPPPRRARRGVYIGAALLLGFVTIGLSAVYLSTRESADAELSGAQWERLLRRMREGSSADAATSLPADVEAEEADASTVPGATERADDDTLEAPPLALGAGADTAHRTADPPADRLPPRELDAQVRRQQADDYAASRNKSIIELQPFRDQESIDISDGAGRRGSATLVNLNPRINAWYLLRVTWQGEDEPRYYHLANALPERQTLVLRPENARHLGIADTNGTTTCDLWSHDNPRRLEEAAKRATPYVMLCDERVILRLTTTGHRTTVEKVTDFLRDTIWGGEKITVFVREAFFQDAFLSTGSLVGSAEPKLLGATDSTAPRPARLSPDAVGRLLEGSDLGLSLEGVRRDAQVPGAWYPLRANPGVFASTMRPSLAPSEILSSHSDIVVRLDDVEAEALAYLVAFDLSQFDIGFATGTDHPRLGWSDRVPEEQRAAGLSGPDGIDKRDPLVATGIVPAPLAPRAVATFTGGFKRTHGGFRYGDLMTVNNGSHYGFIEEGVVFSKLQPGLSTIYVLDDGSFEMKTWSRSDDDLLERIRYARQNGVPIIERAPDGAASVPGAMVSRYGAGNWSGSQDGAYRTLRAGACLQETETRRFLIYAYFSSATPSAMARVFQSYGCTYAMLLDMNALEHTYMAIYSLRGDDLAVEHLVRGMEVLDKEDDGRLLPRFLGYADNRDFFYVLRREGTAATEEVDR